jgi:hypothetical protein
MLQESSCDLALFGCRIPAFPSLSTLADRRWESSSAVDALTSNTVTEKKQDEDRAERDRERSEEAHWQVAEAGAEQARKPAHKQADLPRESKKATKPASRGLDG